MQTQEKNTPLLVSKKSAAKDYLGGVSVRTVDYAIAQGLLETRMIGRRRMIVYRSLVKFAASDHPGRINSGRQVESEARQ